MTKLIFVVGMPGSGKTHYARRLVEDLLAKNHTVLWMDDPSVPLAEYDETDPRRYVIVDKSDLVPAALRHVATARPDYFVLSDPFLCQQSTQLACEQLLAKVGLSMTDSSWIQFENNLNQCLANAAARKDGRNVSNFIKILSKNYHLPESAQLLPVWKPGPT